MLTFHQLTTTTAWHKEPVCTAGRRRRRRCTMTRVRLCLPLSFQLCMQVAIHSFARASGLQVTILVRGRLRVGAETSAKTIWKKCCRKVSSRCVNYFGDSLDPAQKVNQPRQHRMEK